MKKTVCAILIGVIICLLVSPVLASAGTIYESTSQNTTNNYYSGAITTYNDYDNYGKMSPTGDVDWWKISFHVSGTANFWLGNVPSGCNFQLAVYSSNGTTLLGSSTNSGSSAELVTLNVSANTTYYMKVYMASGSPASSSYYLLRSKIYNNLNVNLLAQQEPTTCGAACLRMVLNYYGFILSEDQVKQSSAYTTGYSNGYQFPTLHADILNAFTQYSDVNKTFYYRSYSPKSSLSSTDYLNAVYKNAVNGYPMIVLVAIRDDLDLCNVEHFGYNLSDGHFLVITGVDSAGNIKINDPYSSQGVGYAQYVSLPVACLREYTYASYGPYELTSITWP